MSLAVRENASAFLAPPASPGAERTVRMSESEFYALPNKRVEFIHGEALFMSPVSLPHANLSAFLLEFARRLSRKSGAGKIFGDGVAVRLSPELYRVPDLCFVATTNTRITLAPNHIDGPPDLIVEIVSPESRVRDYGLKFHEYQAAGVTEYFIIDPTYQTIDLYRLNNGKYQQVDEENGILSSAVLPGFIVNPQWLKAPELPDVDSLLSTSK